MHFLVQKKVLADRDDENETVFSFIHQKKIIKNMIPLKLDI